jgi:osmotically-inducible protein OsmY
VKLAILLVVLFFIKETLKMKKNFLLIGAIVLFGVALVACNNTESNMNAGANANANSNTGMMTQASPTATPTPKYTEEQAREEREKAKASKETIGQSLEDAWIHTKLVAKLIGDSKTPERKINVDVVDGAVTLRGEVETAEAKAEAERVAKETDGVKKVTNQLKVVPTKAANTNANKAANANTSGIKNKGKTPQ